MNQSYNKLQVNKENTTTRKLVEMVQREVLRRIKKWNIIIIIEADINDILGNVWIDSLIPINLHPQNHLYFSACIENISSHEKIVETD